MPDTTPPATVAPSNVQDFSDNEIVDGFGEGPAETPLGLGGEEGKQAEPTSTTLEADIVNQTTPGDETPPDDTASDSEPVPEPAGEGGDEPQISLEPETPEFPPALLQMAGYATAEQAQQAGFDDSNALLAAVQWKGKLLSPEVVPQLQEGSLYRPQQAAPPQQKGEPTKVKPFEPANADMLDEELLAVIKQQNDHFAEQLQQQEERFASDLRERDDRTQAQQEHDYESRFDQTVQKLGEDWQDVFGKGEGRTLSLASQRDPAAMTAINHRVMLFSAVEAVREANQKQGFEPMDLDQEVQWALMQRYPEKFQQQLRRKSDAQVQSRRGVQVNRPTARKTPLGNKNERLLSAVDAKLKAKGRPGLDMGDDDEYDGEI